VTRDRIIALAGVATDGHLDATIDTTRTTYW
jgi:hypothetical protein